MTIEEAARILAQMWEDSEMVVTDEVVRAINQVHRVVGEHGSASVSG